MKIIKEPKSSDWHYSFTCKHCSAELEAEATDVKHAHYDGDGPHPSSDVYSVDCPICHKDHIIDRKSLTAIVMLEAEKRGRARTIYNWMDR